MEFHAISDSSPPNTLLKQEGLQLAEASFRDEYSVRQHSEKDMEKSSRGRVCDAFQGNNLKGHHLCIP